MVYYTLKKTEKGSFEVFDVNGNPVKKVDIPSENRILFNEIVLKNSGIIINRNGKEIGEIKLFSENELPRATPEESKRRFNRLLSVI